ncbi:MAG: hypothetical protein ABL921_18605 [Pirellula sp.]
MIRSIFSEQVNGVECKFEPNEDAEYPSTDAPPGSLEKIEVLKRRLAMGLPLWHPADRLDYAGVALSDSTLNWVESVDVGESEKRKKSRKRSQSYAHASA